MSDEKSRILCWYSAGVTSAVAAKIAVEKWGDVFDVRVLYCDTGSEHPDNERFNREIQEWIGKTITYLKSDEYEDIWDVFRKTRWLVGVGGARCTTELKKALRNAYQEPGDFHVFGYDAGEGRRIERFRRNNPEVHLEVPLYDEGLSKADCIRRVVDAGIEIPMMYRLGYRNNNCVGCVKGGMGYWNKIRVDFPDVFDRMARMEREIGAAICKTYAGDGKRKRVFLDELDPNAGNYKTEPDISCGLSCGGQDDDPGRDEHAEQLDLFSGGRR